MAKHRNKNVSVKINSVFWDSTSYTIVIQFIPWTMENFEVFRLNIHLCQI